MTWAKKGKKVRLCVDNSAALPYLQKQGGRVDHRNAILRSFLVWVNYMGVLVEPILVPCEEMTANVVSHWEPAPR